MMERNDLSFLPNMILIVLILKNLKCGVLASGRSENSNGSHFNVPLPDGTAEPFVISETPVFDENCSKNAKVVLPPSLVAGYQIKICTSR